MDGIWLFPSEDLKLLGKISNFLVVSPTLGVKHIGDLFK